MNIRPVLQKDYDTIADLIINELGYQDEKHEDIYTRLNVIEKNRDYQTLVASIDDCVVGFVGLCKTITYEKEDYITVLVFVVSEKYQRQGIGKALLVAVKDYAEKCNIKLLKVSSAFHRGNAHLFYEANGFERKGYTFYKSL